MKEDKLAWAVTALCERAAELGRLPQRSDFSPDDVSRIKSCLGPWPRALEKAGLKQAPSPKARPHPRKRRQAGRHSKNG